MSFRSLSTQAAEEAAVVTAMTAGHAPIFLARGWDRPKAAR